MNNTVTMAAAIRLGVAILGLAINPRARGGNVLAGSKGNVNTAPWRGPRVC